MWLEIFIGLWSLAGLGWYLAVWRVSATRNCPPLLEAKNRLAPSTGPSLQIFKPIPPSALADPGPFVACLESFLTQLQSDDILYLGLPPQPGPAWEPLLARWTNSLQTVPGQAGGRIVVTPVLPAPNGGNPKIIKLRQMAQRATPGFWVWSDADIVAPPGYLQEVRESLQRHPQSLVTGCYHIGELSSAASLADATVINLQLNPGMKMLARHHQLEGAVGALCAFDSDLFYERCGFDHLEACLADDYELGQKMGSIHLIDQPVLETAATGPGWGAALIHALRWQKTIHWCDPRGSALLILVHPWVGWWLVGMLAPPGGLVPWLSAGAAFWLAESLGIGLLFHRQGVRGLSHFGWTVLLAGPLRTLLWLAAWLPLPVRWEARSWTAAREGARPTRTWRTLLAGTAPWATWWALTPGEDPRNRAVGALVVWWLCQALEKLPLKSIDLLFAFFFFLQALHPWKAWGLQLNLLLLGLAWGSWIWQRPFTLEFAREETEPAEWNHPGFLRANYIITGVWSAAFAFNCIWLALPAVGVPPCALAWVPVPLSLGLAALFTKVFPWWYRQRMGMAAAAPGGNE